MARMPGPVSRRLLRRGLIAAVIVLVVAAAIVAYLLSRAPGNVSHPDLQFTRPTTTVAPPPVKKKPVAVDNFVWPWYGFDAGRTRFFDAPANLHPPLHVGWTFFDGALLEFPPVIYHRTLFLLDDDGSARAIDIGNGRVLWHTVVGSLSAASPAVDSADGVVLMPVLSTSGHAPGNGRFLALSMKDGHIVWSRPDGAGAETSPIVSGHTVYYGDQSGTLFARDTRSGHLFWTYHAQGAIKGGPALVGGVLYFGDYAGRAYAVRAVNGHQVWAVATSGTHFGFGSGNFYSTPAVAYGRVYMGNTDGRVYSFGARNGALAWATTTGAYVYSSPAVADPKGLGPTVYIGSYDGNLYAFNAQSGAIRWRHYAGGKISGAPTVLNNVVYFSDLAHRDTQGLDAVTGRQVFAFPDGAFNAIIADYHALYLSGYLTLYQLLPGPAPARRRPAPSGLPRAPAARKRQAPSPGAPGRAAPKRPGGHTP
jgi:outer membrane protein assembly factor BamB